VVVACHLNPDGDALGSLLGASLGLRKLGAKTLATWSDSDAQPPPAYEWMPGLGHLEPPSRVGPASTFLALDCGAADRLGDLEGAARASECLINVDHHPGNDNFGHLNVVVTTASSTAELVARLLEDAGVELDEDIAACLYAGIVTDTGRFQYSNTTPETLRLAADLMSYGVPAPAIAQEVFESQPFGYLKLVGRILDRAELVAAQQFVYSWVMLSDLEETGVDRDQTDGLIDAVRSTNAARVAAIFKEQDDGRFRVSLRSKGPASVGVIARAKGGGGHELAAGFTADDIDATVEEIRVSLEAQSHAAGTAE
jgi:bifunctional oligoribonuclease and PAP phosphatase NrnA